MRWRLASRVAGAVKDTPGDGGADGAAPDAPVFVVRPGCDGRIP